MPITEQQLLQILPNAGPRAGVFVGALNRGMTRGSSPHPWGTPLPYPIVLKKKNNSKILPGQAALAPLLEMRAVLIPQPNPAAPSGPFETYPHRDPAVPQAD